MGTNYYAKIIPTEKDREELIDLIKESKDFTKIKETVDLLYGEVGRYNFEGGIIHLGKQSAGWKFLWNPNTIEVDEGYYDMDNHKWVPNNVLKQKYPLTKEGIRAFIERPDVVVVNEYEEIFSPQDFMDKALNWCKDGLDHKSCYKKYNEATLYSNIDECRMWAKWGYMEPGDISSDFYSDGLRFSTCIDFC